MAFEIVTVPCRQDNYAYLIQYDANGLVVVVDAPEAEPISAALEARGWTLDEILITHHHEDHVAGVEALRGRYGARVIGAEADRRRLPPLDATVVAGDLAGALRARVYGVPGHTRGHVAYHFEDMQALFSGDSLMVMGCGRLFEGSAEEMWASLSALAALPDATLVYSGHEYTAANARFALSVDPDNMALRRRCDEIAALRADGRPTVPAQLGLERGTNPFLRAADKGIRARLGLGDAPDVEVFAELRRRKDAF